MGHYFLDIQYLKRTYKHIFLFLVVTLPPVDVCTVCLRVQGTGNFWPHFNKPFDVSRSDSKKILNNGYFLSCLKLKSLNVVFRIRKTDPDLKK